MFLFYVRQLVIILFFTFYSSLKGQDTYLRVLSIQGDVLIKNNEQSLSWDKLKIGQSILSTSIIKVGKNSYLGYVHSSGRSGELKKDGIYDVNSIITKFNETSKEFYKKYFDFILENLYEGRNSQKRVSLQGAVERRSRIKIDVCMPNFTRIRNKQLQIFWSPIDIGKTYVITLYNKSLSEIKKMEIVDTVAFLEFDSIKFVRDEVYFYNIHLKEEKNIKSSLNSFVIISDKLSESIEKSLIALTNEIGGDDSSINQFLIGSFFEENLLLLDAKECYSSAKLLSPNVETYKENLIRFIKAYNFSRCYITNLSN